MTSANSLESGYFSNQNKLYSMLALYKFFQKNNNGENREYVIARAALISEIQKIRFHVELLKKALSFGFQTFTDVRAALNNRQSPKIISYNENLGWIGRQKIIHGNVYKIYHRDDIINFPADSIMVAYNTNPEYMSAFLQAKAVIVENTSQLSHTAITCREFNIMGVLWAVGCMNFKDNDFIEIDTINKIIKLCQN